LRILIDESLPRKLTGELSGHEVATVQSLGWSSAKNCELLRMAAAEGFEVFVTADQGIEFQQSLRDLGVGVVVLRAPSNRMQHLLPLVPALLSAIDTVRRGEVLRVGG
jgi:predicted nuclease of predicted toxin-antitoxin system